MVVVEVGGGFVLSCFSNSSWKESLNSCRFSAEMNTNSLLGPENCVICRIKMETLAHTYEIHSSRSFTLKLSYTEKYIKVNKCVCVVL